MTTHTVKLGRITDQELDKVRDFFEDCETLMYDLSENGYELENIDFTKFKLLKQEEYDGAFVHSLLETLFDDVFIRKLLVNCTAMLDNCIDKTKDVLEFNKNITDAFEFYNRLQWKEAEEEKPKEGKLVLAFGKNDFDKGRRIRAFYYSKFTREDEDDFNGDLDYDKENDKYFWPEGWYECNECEDVNWMVDFEITHWMELPEPPQQAKEEE